MQERNAEGDFRPRMTKKKKKNHPPFLEEKGLKNNKMKENEGKRRHLVIHRDRLEKFITSYLLQKSHFII